MTASSLFTGGRFAIDPELRGAEFERIIQNLDVHFWKAFWNITEIQVLSVSLGSSDGDMTGPRAGTEGKRRAGRSEGRHEGDPCQQFLLLLPAQSLANMASTTVRVSRLLSLPPIAFEMPLTSDPELTVTISPPLAHTGPGPVLVRLISYDLREGQVGPRLCRNRRRAEEHGGSAFPTSRLTAHICPLSRLLEE